MLVSVKQDDLKLLTLLPRAVNAKKQRKDLLCFDEKMMPVDSPTDSRE